MREDKKYYLNLAAAKYITQKTQKTQKGDKNPAASSVKVDKLFDF